MATPVLDPDSPRLEYAPAGPLRRRRRVRRVILLVLLLAVAFAGYRFGPPAWRRGMLLYAQHRCLSYEAAADQVVYDEGSATAADRAKQAGYATLSFSPPVSVLSTRTMSATIRQAPPLVDFAAQLPPTPVGAPNGPGGFYLYRSWGVPVGATLFLHELRNKAGQRRLAVVQRVPTENGPFVYPFALQVSLYDPAGLWSDVKNASKPPVTTMYFMMDGIIPLIPVKPLKFYAGQVDPNDPAHFTIRYELDGTAGVVDGRLNDAGDDVVIQIVSGPAARPSLWTTFVIDK